MSPLTMLMSYSVFLLKKELSVHEDGFMEYRKSLFLNNLRIINYKECREG